jgi:hypothetical protein
VFGSLTPSRTAEGLDGDIIVQAAPLPATFVVSQEAVVLEVTADTLQEAFKQAEVDRMQVSPVASFCRGGLMLSVYGSVYGE